VQRKERVGEKNRTVIILNSRRKLDLKASKNTLRRLFFDPQKIQEWANLKISGETGKLPQVGKKRARKKKEKRPKKRRASGTFPKPQNRQSGRKNSSICPQVKRTQLEETCETAKERRADSLRRECVSLGLTRKKES